MCLIANFIDGEWIFTQTPVRQNTISDYQKMIKKSNTFTVS